MIIVVTGVAGSGKTTIGMMLASQFSALEEQSDTIVVDVSAPPRWLELIGGHYLDGRQITPDHPIDQTAGALASPCRGPHYTPASLCGLRIGIPASRLRRNQGRAGVGRGSMNPAARQPERSVPS